MQVSKERGEELAVEYGIKFMETSAKASINVEEAFFTLARDIKAKMEKRLVRVKFNLDVQKRISWSNSFPSLFLLGVSLLSGVGPIAAGNTGAATPRYFWD